jgi:hypothetical protein
MPEQPLGRAVEEAHGLVLIDYGNRVDGRVEDRAVQRIDLAATVNAVWPSPDRPRQIRDRRLAATPQPRHPVPSSESADAPEKGI